MVSGSVLSTPAQIFPRTRGLLPLNVGVSPGVVRQFQDAVSLLRAENDRMTHIGRALVYAGELLVRHGNPAHERLVVLISDGAENVLKTRDVQGEVIESTDDTPSIAELIHKRQGVQIQALGVSHAAQLQARLREKGITTPPEPYMIPDHALLSEIAARAGGDPERCGDTEVLEGYFAGLTQGSCRDVVLTRVEVPLQPTAAELAVFQRVSQQQVQQQALGMAAQELWALADKLADLWYDCNTAAKAQVGRYLFAVGPKTTRVLASVLRRAASSHEGFQEWLLGLHQAFVEARDNRTYPPKNVSAGQAPGNPLFKGNLGNGYEVPRVAELFNTDQYMDINRLRLHVAHDQTALSEEAKVQAERDKINRQAAAVLQRRLGQSVLPRTDLKAQCLLQLSLMRDLKQVLDDVLQAYTDFQRSKPLPEPAAVHCEVAW